MAEIDDSGEAFPSRMVDNVRPGMSLRDWFAGQALAGMLADPAVLGEPQVCAEIAYNYADAMLNEREYR